MGVTGMLEVFRREVRVRQGDREYWLPVQEALATAMEAELRAGEVIEVFVIYIGRVDGRAVFLRPRRSTWPPVMTLIGVMLVLFNTGTPRG